MSHCFNLRTGCATTCACECVVCDPRAYPFYEDAPLANTITRAIAAEQRVVQAIAERDALEVRAKKAEEAIADTRIRLEALLNDNEVLKSPRLYHELRMIFTRSVKL